MRRRSRTSSAAAPFHNGRHARQYIHDTLRRAVICLQACAHFASGMVTSLARFFLLSAFSFFGLEIFCTIADFFRFSCAQSSVWLSVSAATRGVVRWSKRTCLFPLLHLCPALPLGGSRLLCLRPHICHMFLAEWRESGG